MAGDDTVPGKVESKRPEDSAFQQQRLKAWQPILTPKYVIGTFFVIGLLFIPIGIVVLNASNSVVEQQVQYTEKSLSAVDFDQFVDFVIAEKMEPPIFFYYKLANFYQNHRRYVKSRSDKQLRGSDDTTACDPLEKDTAGLRYYPCGLIATSFFNDRYQATLTPAGGGTPRLLTGDSWTDYHISWKSDRDEKFKLLDGYTEAQLDDPDYMRNRSLTRTSPRGDVLPLPTDEHFIVWMRTAALPTFKKLNRKILNETLNVGDKLTIAIDNRYDVEPFRGEKWLVISTTSWLGGKNDFLAYAYIVVGSLCLLLAAMFTCKHRCSPRKLGDMQYFNFSGGKSNPAISS